ncbi:MAG: cytochrome b/b6 domain-containing protein [Parvibaculum sp.]
MSDKMARDVSGRFSGVTKLLHWTVAALVLLMLYGGFTLSKETVTTHASIGIVVLALMIVWLTWNRVGPKRPARATGPRWQEILSLAVHHTLYAALVLQPLLGLLLATTSKNNLVVFGLFGLQIQQHDVLHDIGAELHEINGFLIAGLVTLHVAAALYHALILKDNVLKRMLPFAKA